MKLAFHDCQHSLQEKYLDKVIKKHGEGFNWENEPIDDKAVYADRGRKTHGW
jgi:hypothetical protein